MVSNNDVSINVTEKEKENNNNNNEIKSEENKKSTEINSQEKNVVIDVPEVSEQVKENEVSKPKRKRREHVNFFKQFLMWKVYVTAIVAYIILFISSLIVTYIMEFLIADDNDNSGKSTSTNEANVEATMQQSPIFISYVVFFGPILEEILFRLCIFKVIWIIGEAYGQKNKYLRKAIICLAFLVSSFAFGICHFDFDFKLLYSEFVFFPSYFIPGIILAGAYYYDNCFLACILTHILNNSISTLITFSI